MISHTAYALPNNQTKILDTKTKKSMVIECGWTAYNAGMVRYKAGDLIQIAFPTLTREEREFLISGYTPEDWKEFEQLLDQGVGDG